MKRLFAVGLFAGLVAFAAPQTANAGVHVSVGVGLPWFGAVVTSGPFYAPYPPYAYGPPPVYFPAPVYYAPAYRSHWHGRPHYHQVRDYRYGRHCH